jgi:hypothetical protein
MQNEVANMPLDTQAQQMAHLEAMNAAMLQAQRDAVAAGVAAGQTPR